MIEFYYILVSLFGACIGSFINVVRWRIPKNQSLLYPFSYCDKCNSKIKYQDNIPILSWLILKGRCGNCKNNIDISYPMIELMTSGLFVLNSFRPNYFYFKDEFISLIILCIFTSLLISISLIDLDTLTIPNIIIYLGSLTGFVSILIINEFSGAVGLVIFTRILSAVIGFLIVELIVLIFYLITGKMAFGAGDSKFIALLGIWLGLKGMLFSLLLAIYISGIFCIIGLMLSWFKRSDKIPFGPFISLGAYSVVMLGENIFNIF